MVNVLLVDDTPEILILKKRILQHLGCRVITYSEAAQALKLLEYINPFDVIITDMMMPNMNGIQFLEAVKTRHPNARVIVTSVSPYPELKSRAKRKGAAYCLFGGYFTIDHFKQALSAVQLRASA
jgi:CheY-like chemotaxis protein